MPSNEAKPKVSHRGRRQKGANVERLCVDILQKAGIAASRVPLSGGAGGKWAGDVDIPILGHDYRLEVKCQADGFKFFYEKIAPVFGLVVKRDRSEPLICIRLKDFAQLIRKADEYRSAAEDTR